MSKISNFIYKYIFLGNIENLSLKNKIIIFIVSMSCITLLFSWAYVMSNYDATSWILARGFYVLLLGSFYQFFFYDKLKKKYGFYSTVRCGVTYQWTSKGHSFLIPGLIVMALTFGFILDNLTLGSLFAFALLLPFLALFFRIDVFNDNSCILGDEIVFGYHPTCYGIISLLVGIYGYLKVYSLLNYNFNLAIIIFIITVIVQILFLIPDKINKHLFFELRRKNGFLLYATALILTFLVLSSVISDTAIINLNYFDLSFESIIKLIITWGVGIGLAILFARKIKKRGE